MGRHSEYFEVVLAVFAAVLALLFQPLSEHFFASGLLAWLEPNMQAYEAEVIARLSEVVLPVGGSILLILALYRFLKREIVREFRDEDAWLRNELAHLRTEGIGLRIRCQSLREGIPEWIAECTNWADKVIQTIAKISSADAESLKTPGVVPSPRIPLKRSDNPEQIKAYAEHDFYLVRLEKLLEKYSFQKQSWQRRHHAGVAHAP
ncbi:MAG TPA: hypothetical protein VIY51_15640 [Xanthobacteraceae bacterium]